MKHFLSIVLFIGCIFIPASGFAQQQERQSDEQADPSTQSDAAGRLTEGRGGISGTVTTENGLPAVGRDVRFIYGRHSAHPYRFVDLDLILTDVNGRFSATNLLPGEYVISVSWPCCMEKDEEVAAVGTGRNALYNLVELTYFGDTLERKDAVPVVVEANLETSNVNITLRKHPMRKVSGKAIDLDDSPLSGGEVEITRRDVPSTNTVIRGLWARTDERGEWSIEIPDGTYLIVANKTIFKPDPNASNRPPGPPLPLGETHWELSQPKQVIVSGANLSNVVVNMKRRRQIISGLAALDDGSPIPKDVSIDLAFDDYPDVSTADGSFKAKAPELGLKLLKFVVQPYEALYVKSITCDGVDYLRAPLEFGNGVDYKDIRVVLSSSGGFFQMQPGASINPATGKGQVWLVPEDERDWRAPLTWIWGSKDHKGIVSFYGAPGKYLLIGDETDKWFGADDLDKAEDYVRALAPTAMRVTLKPGTALKRGSDGR